MYKALNVEMTNFTLFSWYAIKSLKSIERQLL